MRGLRGDSFVKSFPVTFLFILQISNRAADPAATYANKLQETPMIENDEARMKNDQLVSCHPVSSFVIRICFVIRHSDFVIETSPDVTTTRTRRIVQHG
jgi:hypothetical protein